MVNFYISFYFKLILAIFFTAILPVKVSAEPVSYSSESFWSFGEIDYSESVSKEFEITNTGQDELKIHYETNSQRYEEYPDGSRKTNYYNNVGLLISFTDPNRTIVSLDYDNAGRLTNKLITRASGIEGTTFENFGYDGLGRMTFAEDDDSVVERWYNSYGEVIEEKQTTTGNLTQSVTSEYNIEGFRTKLTYPNDRQVIYAPDALNRIDVVSEAGSIICDYNYAGPYRVRERNYQPNSISPISLTVFYNANRWATEYSYTGAKTWQATEIDKKGKPKKYDYVPQTIGFVYDFDKEGNKKYEKLPHENGKGDLFRYDNVYRLTGVKYGVQNPENWVGNFDNVPYTDREIFNMDNVGNRTSVTNGSTTNYTTNNLNQYTAINGLSPTYDLNGNMLSDGYNTSTVYDYTNHPVRFDNADYTVEMKYDVLGRRIEKKSTAKATSDVNVERYILDGARVISDADVTCAVYKDYVWGNGIDELLATAKGRSTKYDFCLNNSLGSITHIANNKAEVQESYKYKVYGTVSIYDKKGDAITKSKEKNRYMFTGREYSTEIKSYFYQARYYISQFGRFAQRDLVDKVKDNLYIYANNNPLIFSDPSGQNVFTTMDGIWFNTILYESQCDCPDTYISASFQNSHFEPGYYLTALTSGSYCPLNITCKYFKTPCNNIDSIWIYPFMSVLPNDCKCVFECKNNYIDIGLSYRCEDTWYEMTSGKFSQHEFKIK